MRAGILSWIAVVALAAGCARPIPSTRRPPPKRQLAPPAAQEAVGIITTIAGDGWIDADTFPTGRFTGDGGPATEASLNVPLDLVVRGDGSLYVADTHNGRVREIGRNGVITTVAGGGRKARDGARAGDAYLGWVYAIALVPDGSLYIGNTDDVVRQIDPRGFVITVAGDGWHDISGGSRLGPDGVPATKSSLNHPAGLALDVDGSLYIADAYNNRIRVVDRTGVIETFAGRGRPGQEGSGVYSGDGGPATEADIATPMGLAVGEDGSLYIADCDNHRIRRVSPDGVIMTVAGDGWEGERGEGRHAGDGGPATRASLNFPADVAPGPDGSLYIADTGNHRIRRVDGTGIITTVAGNGSPGYSGDDGLATRASLNQPAAVAMAADGTLYIADSYNNRIRKVAPARARAGASKE
jgi:sugar lactone lactonase YvrE